MLPRVAGLLIVGALGAGMLSVFGAARAQPGVLSSASLQYRIGIPRGWSLVQGGTCSQSSVLQPPDRGSQIGATLVYGRSWDVPAIRKAMEADLRLNGPIAIRAPFEHMRVGGVPFQAITVLQPVPEGGPLARVREAAAARGRILYLFNGVVLDPSQAISAYRWHQINVALSTIRFLVAPDAAPCIPTPTTTPTPRPKGTASPATPTPAPGAAPAASTPTPLPTSAPPPPSATPAPPPPSATAAPPPPSVTPLVAIPSATPVSGLLAATSTP